MMKDIPGYEGEYAVTDCGRVWSHRLGRWILTHITNGYHIVNLRKDGTQKRKSVHRLVAETFVENTESKTDVDHIDGDRLNNKINNLRWATRSENNQNQKAAKGYSWHNKNQKWMAYIAIDQKLIHLGYYDTEAEARQSYLDAKKIYHPTSPINK